MKIIINGIVGYMGHEMEKLVLAGVRGAEFAGGADPRVEDKEGCAKELDALNVTADCLVDFSHHSCTEKMLAWAVKNGIPTVIATTGQTDEEKQMILEASKKIPVFFAANYSLGIALLAEMARKVAAAMPEAEIEIIEKHHDRKLDAPSGTALALAEAIREVRPAANLVKGRAGMGKRQPDDIGIHAIRMGNIVGEHEIMIGTPNQTITLKHEAHDRALFAEGALAAAEFLMKQNAGLYDMKSLVSF